MASVREMYLVQNKGLRFGTELVESGERLYPRCVANVADNEWSPRKRIGYSPELVAHREKTVNTRGRSLRRVYESEQQFYCER